MAKEYVIYTYDGEINFKTSEVFNGDKMLFESLAENYGTIKFLGVFHGSEAEVETRVEEIHKNQNRSLKIYIIAPAEKIEYSYTLSRGQEAVDFFLEKSKEKGMKKIGDGRIEGNGGGYLLSFHGTI